MFTVSWSKPVDKKKEPKRSQTDMAWFYKYGYYPDQATNSVLVTPVYTGNGETLDDAITDLKSKITATHSKNVDAKVEATLSEFNKGLTKS